MPLMISMPIGCQTYPVRKLIEKDFPGTLKDWPPPASRPSSCVPPSATPVGFAGIGQIQSGRDPKIFEGRRCRLRKLAFQHEGTARRLSGRIAWAKESGMTQMFVPTLTGPANPTMDDVKRVADEYNKMGEQAAKAGILQGLHNEDFEMTTVDGKRTYDLLLDLLDPKLIAFQFQVSTISRGYDAAEYFTKYPGRFISMHAQDWSTRQRRLSPWDKATWTGRKYSTPRRWVA